MNKINLSTVRLFLVLIFLVSFSFIFASIFFVVTNSDVNEYIPYGQAQLTFENNELEEIDFEMTGNGSWSVDCNESYTGLCSIKSDSISHNENSTINISISIINGGILSFYYKVDSEYSPSGDEFYDGLKFYVDGELEEQFQPSTNGNSNWNLYFKFN